MLTIGTPKFFWSQYFWADFKIFAHFLSIYPVFDGFRNKNSLIFLVGKNNFAKRTLPRNKLIKYSVLFSKQNVCGSLIKDIQLPLNPLSGYSTHWQQPTNCLSVFDHFVGFTLNVLSSEIQEIILLDRAN